MQVLLGIPDKPSQLLDKGTEDISVRKLNFHSHTLLSLSSIISSYDKINDLEKKYYNLLNNIFTQLNSNFLEDFKKSNLPKNKNEYFEYLINIKLSKRISIEDLIFNVETSFKGTEKAVQSKFNEFNKSIRRAEIDRKKLSGNLKEACLNIFAEEINYEFIKEYFIVAESNSIDSLFELETIAKSTLQLIIDDKNYKLFKFFGLKSAEVQVKEKCSKLGLIYKPFLSSEQFEIIKLNLKDFEVQRSEFFTFLVSKFKGLLELNFYFKFVKCFLSCILIYGLPTDYVFYFVKSQKIEQIKEFFKGVNKEIDFGDKRGIKSEKYECELSVVDLELPIYEEQ